MKKILLLICCLTYSLNGMSHLSDTPKDSTLVTQHRQAVVAYNEKTQMIYPVCDFDQQFNCFGWYSILFTVKHADGTVKQYDKNHHGSLFLTSKADILLVPTPYKWSRNHLPWKVKSAFWIDDPTLKPLTNDKLILERHGIDASGNQTIYCVKETKSLAYVHKILALTIAIGYGAYLAQSKVF